MSVKPSDFKDLIPSPGGSLCQKIAKAFQLPTLVYNWVASMFNDDGSFTDSFKTLICALGCTGGGTPNPQNPKMPSPGGVQASDGSFADKVQVTWNGVTPPAGIAAVTKYNVYRATSDVTDPSHATVVGTTVAGITTYDDTTVAAGTTYNYWVTATNVPSGAETSGYSNYDVGHAGTTSNDMPAVSDLRVTKGHSAVGGSALGLIWTPTAGATKWDIYRSTTNDPATAVVIDSNRVAQSTFDHTPNGPISGPQPQEFWDNVEELLYLDVPPNAIATYYYWVVGKKDSPPATSPKSNSDWGSVALSFYGSTTLQVLALGDTQTDTVTGGENKVRFAVLGSRAGGAGGGAVFGGGGGGASAVIYGEHVPVVGAKYKLITGTTGHAAAEANGAAGAVTKLQYSADGTFGDTIDLATCNAPGGGLYAAAGGGAGGALASGSVHASVTNSAIMAGHAGSAAAAGVGGRGGHRFGSRRFWPSHSGGGGWSPFLGDLVGGSMKAPDASSVALATGGSGTAGFAVLAYAS